MKQPFDDIPDPWGSTPVPVPPPVPATPGPPRRAVIRRRAVLISIAVAAAAVPLTMGLRANWTSVWASAAASSTLSVIALVGAGRHRRPLVAVLAALAALTGLSAAWTSDGSGSGDDPRSLLACAVVAAALAIWVYAWSAAALRRSFVADARLRASLLAVAGSGLAAAALTLRCPAGGTTHVVFGHVAGPLGLMFAIALATARWLRI